MSTRSHKVLSLNEKMKVLDFVRKKLHVEVGKVYGKNESSTHEIVKKEKEVHADFAATPSSANSFHHMDILSCHVITRRRASTAQ